VKLLKLEDAGDENMRLTRIMADIFEAIPVHDMKAYDGVKL
jgi:hypothetical protein